MAATGRILVGTCNWSDHRGFYPQGMPPAQRLEYYSRFFPLVEVDTAFYGIARPETAERWVDATPAAFRFNVKAYRSLTLHERGAGRPRQPTGEEVRAFMDLLEPMRQAGKLRAVHYQFPPWFKASAPNMDFVARLADRHPDDQVIVEFRHNSWAEPERFDSVTELLAESAMTYCVVDEPQVGSATMPPHLVVTSPRLAVVRFHGHNRKKWYVKDAKSSTERFDYLYREETLAQWAPRLRDLAAEAEEVHALFNNNRSNYAVVNGLQLAQVLDLGLPPPESVPVLVEAEQEKLPL
ncbi:MAG: hypothetical protein QOK05_2593 [Chloroflexota bacterium]|jgi:uncharacterized protein YecE (DUF72 family)|nr:hypothetical protein [Chloroflexota bacterium]